MIRIIIKFYDIRRITDFSSLKMIIFHSLFYIIESLSTFHVQNLTKTTMNEF